MRKPAGTSVRPRDDRRLPPVRLYAGIRQMGREDRPRLISPGRPCAGRPPTEPGHTALFLPVPEALRLLANDGDRPSWPDFSGSRQTGCGPGYSNSTADRSSWNSRIVGPGRPDPTPAPPAMRRRAGRDVRHRAVSPACPADRRCDPRHSVKPSDAINSRSPGCKVELYALIGRARQQADRHAAVADHPHRPVDALHHRRGWPACTISHRAGSTGRSWPGSW